jgi:hypothetical protein
MHVLGSPPQGQVDAGTDVQPTQQLQYLAFVENKFRALRRRADWLLVTGEYLHVVRPVLYVLALRR